jgi:hypothetical protein
MKKGVLILLGMFIMVSTTEAKIGEKSLITKVGVYHNYNNAVSFFERDIQFHVFLNGDFDFEIQRNTIYYDYNGRRNRKNSTRILRDNRGRITNVGTTRISYDFKGNVIRIGRVIMNYKFGNLTRVGGLIVSYNNWGEAFFNGQVRRTSFYTDSFGINFNLSIGAICAYNDPYFFRNDFRNNYSQIREDNDFYYYKANRNAKVGKRSTILKRRKLSIKFDKRKRVKRDSNNSYRKPSKDKKIDIKKDTRRRTNSLVKKNNKNPQKRPTNRKKRS